MDESNPNTERTITETNYDIPKSENNMESFQNTDLNQNINFDSMNDYNNMNNGNSNMDMNNMQNMDMNNNNMNNFNNMMNMNV